MGDALLAANVGVGRTVVRVFAKSNDTCVILDNATLKCWGGNTNGGLGPQASYVGRSPATVGDTLSIVNLGNGRTASDLAMSGAHACAVLDDSSLEC